MINFPMRLREDGLGVWQPVIDEHPDDHLVEEPEMKDDIRCVRAQLGIPQSHDRLRIDPDYEGRYDWQSEDMALAERGTHIVVC